MNKATESITTWIKIGQVMRSFAMVSANYAELVKKLNAIGITKTPDGIDLNDPTIDGKAVHQMVASVRR